MELDKLENKKIKLDTDIKEKNREARQIEQTVQDNKIILKGLIEEIEQKMKRNDELADSIDKRSSFTKTIEDLSDQNKKLSN